MIYAPTHPTPTRDHMFDRHPELLASPLLGAVLTAGWVSA